MNVDVSTLPPATGVPMPAPDQRCFTIVSEGRSFGLPVDRIHTVFEIMTLTPVPLAPPEILGLVNLRGKIATAISLRRRMSGDPRRRETSNLAIGLEHRGEVFALIVDEVGDVLTTSATGEIGLPSHLGAEKIMFKTVYRLDDKILPILDLDWVLAVGGGHA